MDPVIGALIAATVGWTSILAAIFLPVEQVVRAKRLRTVGAVTLALIGLSALGVPMPDQAPLGFLAVGLVGAAVADSGYLTSRQARILSSSSWSLAGRSSWFMSTSWLPQSGQIGWGNPITDPRPVPPEAEVLSNSYSGATCPQSSHRKMNASIGRDTPEPTFKGFVSSTAWRLPSAASV